MYRASIPSTQSRVRALQTASYASADDDFSDTDCIPSSQDPASLLPPYIAKTPSFNTTYSPSSSRHITSAATPSLSRSSAVSPRSIAATATSATPSLLLPLAMSSPSASRVHRTPPSSRRRAMPIPREIALDFPSRPHPSLRATIIGNSESDTFSTESPVPSLMSDAVTTTPFYRSGTDTPLNSHPKVIAVDTKLLAPTSTPTSATPSLGVHTPRSLPLLMNTAPVRAPRSVRATRTTVHAPTSTQGVGAGAPSTTPTTGAAAGGSEFPTGPIAASPTSSFSAATNSSSSSSSGLLPSSSSTCSLPPTSSIHASITAKAPTSSASRYRASTSYPDSATPSRPSRTHATDSTLSPEYLDHFTPKVQRKLAMLTGEARERYQRRLLKQRIQYHARKNEDPQNDPSRKRGRVIKIDFVRAPAPPPGSVPAPRKTVNLPAQSSGTDIGIDVKGAKDTAKKDQAESASEATQGVVDHEADDQAHDTAAATSADGMIVSAVGDTGPIPADITSAAVDTTTAAETLSYSSGTQEPAPSSITRYTSEASLHIPADDCASTDSEIATLMPPVKKSRRASVNSPRLKPTGQTRRRSRRNMMNEEEEYGGDNNHISGEADNREMHASETIKRVTDEQREEVKEEEDEEMKRDVIKQDNTGAKTVRKSAKRRKVMDGTKQEPIFEPMPSCRLRRSARNASIESADIRQGAVEARIKHKIELEYTPRSHVTPSSSFPSSPAFAFSILSETSSPSTSMSPTTISSDASSSTVTDNDTDAIHTQTEDADTTIIDAITGAQSQELSGTSSDRAETESRMVDADHDNSLHSPIVAAKEASGISETCVDLPSPFKKAITTRTTAAKRRTSRATATAPSAQAAPHEDVATAPSIAEESSEEGAATSAENSDPLVDAVMTEDSSFRATRGRGGKSDRGRAPRQGRTKGTNVFGKTTQNTQDTLNGDAGATQEALDAVDTSIAASTTFATPPTDSAVILEPCTPSVAIWASVDHNAFEDTTISLALATTFTTNTTSPTSTGAGIDTSSSITPPDGHSVSANAPAVSALSDLSPVIASTTREAEVGNGEDECFCSLLHEEKERILALVEQQVMKVNAVYDRLRRMEDRVKGQLTHVKIEFNEMLSSLLGQYHSLQSSASPDTKTELETLKTKLQQKRTECAAKIKAISLRLQQKHAVLQAFDIETEDDTEF